MRNTSGSHLTRSATALLVAASLAAAQGLAQVAQSGSTVAQPSASTQTEPARRPTGPAIGVPTLGMPSVHDPSTVVRFHGRYYVYSTGRGIPFFSSPDLETWTREGSIFPQIPDAVHAAVPKNNGTDVWAPDIVRVGGQFYLYYAVSSWGSFNSAIALATNPVLDPKDPAYKWTDRGIVVSSNGNEDLNAIDPGVILAPDGTLWICYGSYHGSIRITQLDPRTGLALKPQALGQAIATARESEASDIIFHDGFYYLFVNHGSCCKGKDSQYNIRVGRSRDLTGPYLDRHQKPLTESGGSLFLAAHDHRIGPGHFGRLLDYDASPTGAEPDGAEPNGVERFSIHYEADLATGGRPRLDIRPLLWSPDGWPVAGDNLPEATYQILSRQTENTLEEHVPAPPKPAVAAATPTPPELPSPPTLHLTRYLTLDNEKWTITPTPGGFYKIVNLATSDAIGASAASTGATPLALAPYTGADAQQWRLDQFPDGSYSIRNKATGLCLAASDSAKDPNSIVAIQFKADDLHRWTITTP